MTGGELKGLPQNKSVSQMLPSCLYIRKYQSVLVLWMRGIVSDLIRSAWRWNQTDETRPVVGVV